MREEGDDTERDREQRRNKEGGSHRRTNDRRRRPLVEVAVEGDGRVKGNEVRRKKKI